MTPIARHILPLLALGLVAGCDFTNTDVPERSSRIFEQTPVSRGYAVAFSEFPFEKGAIDIVAVEGGQMRSFRLVTCRGGGAICADDLNGPAGSLTITPDYYIVRGLYGGRDFYLSPGGDGAIYYGANRASALAWNNIG
jgi:hypothetical protein